MIASLLQNTLLAASLFSSAIAAGDHALTASRALGAAEFSCPTTDEEGRGLRARYVPPPAPQECQTIGEIVQGNPMFSILAIALEGVGLLDAVSDKDATFTVFAPTDDAFANVDPDLLQLLLDNPDTLLAEVLLYHVLPCKVTSVDLVSLHASPITITTAASLDDNTFDAIVCPEGVFLQGDGNAADSFQDLPQVIDFDVEACNGVIHVINQVIIPAVEVPLPTIFGIAQEAAGFTTLVALLEATGLDEAVDDPDASLTVFTPSDAAFALVDGDFVNYLSANTDILSLILTYHVVAGVLTSQDLVAHPAPTVVTLAEQTITPDVRTEGLVLENVNNVPALVELPDVQASNGMVHAINKVLVPLLPVDATAALNGFTVFNTAIQTAGLTATFNSLTADFTVLVPTNEAFLALGDTLETVLQDVETLTKILATHVIPGPGLPSSKVLELTDITTTLSEVPLKVKVRDTGLFIAAPGNGGDGAKVVNVDIKALGDSIIHVIDTVLLPGA